MLAHKIVLDEIYLQCFNTLQSKIQLFILSVANIHQYNQGHSVLIDLRNETSVAGRIESADGFMNITLTDAVFIDRNGLQYPFELFMVRDRMIRQIHIPAAFDVENEVQEFMEHGLRRKKPVKKLKRTFKMKRAEERHKEILQEIENQKSTKESN